MTDIDPILLLLIGLIVIAAMILWVFSIFVAVRMARQRGRNGFRWGMLALATGLVPPGTVCLGAGYMAYSYRRSPAGWAAGQFLAFWVVAAALVAAAVAPGRLGGAPLLGRSLGTDLAILLGACVTSLSPLWLMAVRGPVEAERARKAGPLIQASRVHKYYHLGARSIHVLRGVSLSVQPGEFVAILGASGSGKSTLLHILGMLDWADSGAVVLDGVSSDMLTGPQSDRMRCHDIGFVFQFYHLLPELNVLDNVLLPVRTASGVLEWPRVAAGARARAMELLDRLGLTERVKHRPRELSGGEQQRVAIARALINRPRLLLADEPTGNLDSRTGSGIMKLLKQLNDDTGQTIIMVTHDQALAAMADRVVRLTDGRLR